MKTKVSFSQFIRTRTLPLLLITLIFGQTATGTIIALTSSGGIPDVNTGVTFGQSFTPLVDIMLHELGVYDESQNGLAEAHEIAVYRESDQALIASTIIALGTAAPLQGEFRYNTISSVRLNSGNSYRIAVHYNLADDKLFGSSITSTDDAPIDTGSFFSLGSSISYPTELDFDNRTFANFVFTVVPEPSSSILLLLSTFSLLRRKRCMAFN